MSQQASTLILILLMVVAFYFLILRPQKRRQQALQKTMRELEPGDQVLLGSGLFGRLVSIGTKQAVLEIAPGVELTVLKQAIIRRATDADVDAVSEDEVGDELEAEGTATYDSGDPEPVVRAEPDLPSATPPTSTQTSPSATTDTDRSNLR
jgi:preprotein translocase subunit YajC